MTKEKAPSIAHHSKLTRQSVSYTQVARRIGQMATVLCAIACCPANGEVINSTLMHDNKERNYILHVPSSYQNGDPVPLVLALHGAGQNGTIQMRDSQMNEVSEREGFIVAYPSALQGSWAADTPDINLGFFDDLIATIRSDYSIDDSRIYSTGLSQGAVRSYMLAVERPDVFAAIAPVGGVRPLRPGGILFPEGLPNTPNRPFPMMHVHGTLDSVVPIEGGNGISLFPSVESVLNEWRERNGCEAAANAAVLPDEEPEDNRFVTLYTNEDCTTYLREDGAVSEAEILFYEVNRGGHEWFREPRLDTSSMVWDFFSRHSLPAQVMVGDFNHDAVLDAADIDLLATTIGSSQPQFDLDDDGIVGIADREIWINELKNSFFGDSNLDGEFNSGDFIHVFQRGEYEDSIESNSGWEDGDWNGDGEFDSGDFILAFQSAGYEVGPRSPANVPEPSSIALMVLGVVCVHSTRRFGKRTKQTITLH